MSLLTLAFLALVFGTTIPFVMLILQIVRPLMLESDVQKRLALFKERLVVPKVILAFTGYIALAFLFIGLTLPGIFYGFNILEIITSGSILGLAVGGFCAVALWFFVKKDLQNLYPKTK